MKPPAARESGAEWLSDDDVLDDETDTTLRVPHYASVAIGDIVSPLPLLVPPEISVMNDPPRRRSSPLLRATLCLCAVAIVFELGWWGGSQLAPPSAPSLAATKSPPLRTALQKAPRTLAPLEEPRPQPQAPVEKPTPNFVGFMVPASAASAPLAVAPTVAPTATAASTATAAPTAHAAPVATATATATATVAPRPIATATGTALYTPNDL